VYIFIISLLAVVLFFRYYVKKGTKGELLVNIAIKIYLGRDYHLLRDITLPSGDGTTQIDHILVSEYGIFVIETKYMRGVISGTIRKKQWSQKVDRKIYKFQNPLNQNYKHIKTLESLLAIDRRKLISIVVFMGDSRFGSKMPPNVAYQAEFIKYIKSKTKKIISKDEVAKILYQIDSTRLKRGAKTNREHIAYLKHFS
jgi:hypothetical protein